MLLKILLHAHIRAAIADMTQTSPGDEIARIDLSDEERDTGALTPEHMYHAVDRFFKDGVVVLENAIPSGILDELNERMKVDTEQILSGNIGDIHWKYVLRLTLP